jgi:hypothetical protein
VGVVDEQARIPVVVPGLPQAAYRLQLPWMDLANGCWLTLVDEAMGEAAQNDGGWGSCRPERGRHASERGVTRQRGCGATTWRPVF